METQLEELARPVKYELEMFAFLHAKIARRKETQVGTGSDPADDAYLESFLLHARILRDFFCNKRSSPRTLTCPSCAHSFERPGPQNDDLLAMDFVDEYDQQETEHLKTLRTPLNKLLAHLTQGRQQYTTRSYLWEPEKIYAEIQPMIEHFRDCLPDERRAWFGFDI